MPLNVGSRLGHYDVTALIGEGGMGQVYQATDTQLKRQVALKILPEAFAADPERLSRFQREAEVLASLNHPYIAQIHGLEEGDGIRALVLELVEGPTLADRIKQGPIPLDEALPIAKQIAEELPETVDPLADTSQPWGCWRFEGETREFRQEMARPAGFEPATLGLEGEGTVA